MSSMQTFSIVGNCLQGTLPAQCATLLSLQRHTCSHAHLEVQGSSAS